MAKPNSKAPLGEGGRFAALAKKTGSKALAAYIGRKKYGAKKMAQLSAAGKRSAHGSGPFSHSEMEKGYKCLYDANDLAQMDNKQNQGQMRPKGARGGSY